MSTGINIKSASYGVGSTNVDVTAEVTSKILDGALNLPVTPAALGIDDPAPGQLKTLTIKYSINNGSVNTITEKDGGTAVISAPAERVASGLQITKAEYGYPGNYQDVTDAVQNYLKEDGSINLKVGFKEVGLPDPNPSKKKNLTVEYTLNGSKNQKSFDDGENWKMSAPPNVKNKNTKATDFVWNFFKHNYLEPETQLLLDEWESLQVAMRHRIMYPDSKAGILHQAQIHKRQEEFFLKHPQFRPTQP